jgi:ribosomal protein S19
MLDSPARALSSRPESQQAVDGFDVIRCGNKEDHFRGFKFITGTSEYTGALYDQMKREHEAFENVAFQSNNYGITTNSKLEWQRVVEGDVAFEENVKCKDGLTMHRRLPACWKDEGDGECRHRDVDDAGERSRRVMADLGEKYDLSREEVISIILYTGPMYRVYNCLLEQYTTQLWEQFRGGFRTTIAVIVTALEKLSRRSKAPQTLYRGGGGWGRLPDRFWAPEEEDVTERGFTLFGFTSTTSDIDVALRYSGALECRPHPTVICIDPGPDEGLTCAVVQQLSQFPGEIECIFPPCCYIEPILPHRVRYCDVNGVLVPVISARILTNYESTYPVSQYRLTLQSIWHAAADFIDLEQGSDSLDNQDIGDPMSNFAATRTSLGHDEDALAMEEIALEETQRRVLTSDNQDIGDPVSNFAATRTSLGHDEDALAMEEIALEETQRRVLTSDNQDIGDPVSNFAATRTSLGHDEDALAMESSGSENKKNHDGVLECAARRETSWTFAVKKQAGSKLRYDLILEHSSRKPNCKHVKSHSALKYPNIYLFQRHSGRAGIAKAAKCGPGRQQSQRQSR